MSLYFEQIFSMNLKEPNKMSQIEHAGYFQQTINESKEHK